MPLRHLLAPWFCGEKGIDIATLVFSIARRGAPCKSFTQQKVDNQLYLFLLTYAYKQVCVIVSQNKRDVIATSPCSVVLRRERDSNGEAVTDEAA